MMGRGQAAGRKGAWYRVAVLPRILMLLYSCAVVLQSRAGVTMMAEGVARRDAVAGAALAAGVAVVAPQAASARGNDGRETGAFAGESYSKYQKGRPRNQAPVVSFFLARARVLVWRHRARFLGGDVGVSSGPSWRRAPRASGAGRRRGGDMRRRLAVGYAMHVHAQARVREPG